MRVVISGLTDVVVLVPVHTAVPAGRRNRGLANQGRGVQRALGPALAGGGDVVATAHAILTGGRADKGAVFAFLRHVVGTDGHVVYPVVGGGGRWVLSVISCSLDMLLGKTSSIPLFHAWTIITPFITAFLRNKYPS